MRTILFAIEISRRVSKKIKKNKKLDNKGCLNAHLNREKVLGIMT